MKAVRMLNILELCQSRIKELEQQVFMTGCKKERSVKISTLWTNYDVFEKLTGNKVEERITEEKYVNYMASIK